MIVCFKLISHDVCAFAAAVTDIDTSGIHALEELYRSLQKRHVQVKTWYTIVHLLCYEIYLVN